MSRLAITALVVIILALFVLAVLFLFWSALFPPTFDPNQVWREGCWRYCEEIKRTAASTGESIAAVAVHTGLELEAANASFIKACRILWTDVVFPWDCWNRPGCCSFGVVS